MVLNSPTVYVQISINYKLQYTYWESLQCWIMFKKVKRIMSVERVVEEIILTQHTPSFSVQKDKPFSTIVLKFAEMCVQLFTLNLYDQHVLRYGWYYVNIQFHSSQ